MGQEIERKFLIHHDKWEQIEKPAGKTLKQGYILTDPHKTIRVRTTDNKAWLTIKGISTGATRLEYEYEIPLSEAIELLDNFSDTALEKVRYEIIYAGKTWEIDVFSGDNLGLVVAEIELESEDEYFDLPTWVSTEITSDQRYYNSNLTKHPFKDWQ